MGHARAKSKELYYTFLVLFHAVSSPSMSNRIPLEELNHQLNTFQNTIEAWSKERIVSAGKLKTDFKENQSINAGRHG